MDLSYTTNKISSYLLSSPKHDGLDAISYHVGLLCCQALLTALRPSGHAQTRVKSGLAALGKTGAASSVSQRSLQPSSNGLSVNIRSQHTNNARVTLAAQRCKSRWLCPQRNNTRQNEARFKR